MEYSRKVPLMANGIALEGSAAGERQLDFGSVHIEEKVDKKEVKLLNVSPDLNKASRICTDSYLQLFLLTGASRWNQPVLLVFM